ncbi:MAG: InlB B-repeat-containing protein [Pseudoflavonifractor capillosus]|uniref:InlB B-repeat-containing protein n=2 Tax=Pseudoflavonifractor capillosus TaxID=106588 RepID=UPI002A836E8D|nr:InlB B-repeat-containing protein [Pseudoflavonifractor capillosus]MCI5928708.1 InlB B-repeat-containing protein [Pseudoflavonifractor capillosus]MDY4661605.1 InlB B-repeat-containing protein [Pseudoflavonifractor capillosus]
MLARMSKKALALLMVFCMVVSALSVGALAAVDTPNGTYDGILTFEYHVTASALKDMVKNETEYTYDDIHGATLFFEDCSRDLVWNWAPDIYWTAVSALEEKHPQDMIALELYLDNGCTQKTLRFSDEELQAMFYEEAASGFYEIELKDSGSTEPELVLQDVYVYVDAKEGQGTPNDRGYFTVGKIQMKLPKASEVVAGENYYAQYGSSVSLENIERFAANSWLNLADVEWYKLLVADGADNYVDSGEYVWHLDGKLLDKVQLYYVTYDANGGEGTVTDEKGYMAGQTFDPKSGAGLTREGYDFVGWSTNKYTTVPDETFAIPAEGGDVTLYAVWQPEKPAVESYVLQYYYKVNNTYVSFASEVYEDGETATIISGAPTMPGYTLAGWNTKPDGTGTTYKAGDKLTMTASQSLYAVWQPEEPAVENYILQYYYKDNNTFVTFDSKSYESGEVAVVISEAPSMPGYTFAGWNTEPYGTGTTYKAGDKLTMTASMSLYAQFTKDGGTDPDPETYDVHYVWVGDVPEGVTLPDSASYTADTEVTVAQAPTVEGYTFSGWGSDVVTIRDGKFVMPPYEVYLTGIWTKDGDPQPNTYTITFKTEAGGTINGGTDNVTGTYTEGAAFPERPATAANSGYSFAGWYDESGNKVTEWPATVTASATYTAKWTEDGGTGPIDPDPSYMYYHVTVNYLDRADGSKIASSYTSPSHIEGSRYDVSEQAAITIDGYTYDGTEGDAVTGTLNGNKTVNVYYVADETDIDDGDTPTTDLPDVPGEGGGETDIGDGETPTTDLPDTGDTGSTGDGSETDIPDGETPTGSLPQTGTQAQVSMARVALSVMALTASVAAAGLALILFRKSRKNA